MNKNNTIWCLYNQHILNMIYLKYYNITLLYYKANSCNQLGYG